MDTTMSMHAIVNEVSAWDGVLTLRPGPGDGSPEISWGDRLAAPGPCATADPSTPDQVMPHPAYADLGWVAVVNPAERTHDQVVALLQTAHQAALARWYRRQHNDRPAPVEDAS